MIYSIVAVCLVFLALICSRPITTFIHEMGHAIPSLLFTNGEVHVYVGTYGRLDKSRVIKIGRFHFLFRFNIFDWDIGYCTHEVTTSFWKRFIIILGGPLFSLFTFIFLGLLIKQYDAYPMIQFVIGIFLAAGILDFIVNIIPSNQASFMEDGSVLWSDGSQLKRLLRRRNYPALFTEAENHFYNKDYAKSSEQFYTIIENGVHTRELYLLLAASLKNEERYVEAVSCLQQMSTKFTLGIEEYEEMADVYSKMEYYDRAIACYDKALFFSYLNIYLINKKGMVYLKMGNYHKAIDCFEKAIKIDDQYTDAKSNLALAQETVSQLNR